MRRFHGGIRRSLSGMEVAVALRMKIERRMPPSASVRAPLRLTATLGAVLMVAGCGNANGGALFSPDTTSSLSGSGGASGGNTAPLGNAGASGDANAFHLSDKPGSSNWGGASGAAAGGTSAGMGEAGSNEADSGATKPCVPSPEICNGQDDNCDGVIDEGCPEQLAWDAAKKASSFGDSAQGAEFSENCAGDEVLVGLEVGVDAWIDQVSGVCAKLTVAPSGAQVPFVYAPKFGASRVLSPYPATTASPIRDLLCPSGSLVVGIRISQQNAMLDGVTPTVVIPKLWITCAEPALELSATPARVAWSSSAEIGPIAGSYADQTAWFEGGMLDAPAIWVGVFGNAGSKLDRIGGAVANVDVSFIGH